MVAASSWRGRWWRRSWRGSRRHGSALGATPPEEPVTRMARKSLTLVRVGPVIDLVAQSVEQAVAVVVGKARARVDAECARPGKGVRAHDRAGGGAGAVDAVGVARQRPDMRQPVQRDGEAEQELDVAPAAPPPRTVTVVSPPESSTQGAGSGWPVATTDRAMPAMTLPTSAAFPSSASPRISGAPRFAGHGGGGFQRQLRRGDHDGLDAGKPRIAGLRRLVAGSGQMGLHRSRRLDAVAGARIAAASAKVVGSATVGPERSPPDRRRARRR